MPYHDYQQTFKHIGTYILGKERTFKVKGQGNSANAYNILQSFSHRELILTCAPT